MKLHTQKGFIALISAILISAALLLIASSLSFTSYYGRFNILDMELKLRSAALAEACADQSLLELTNNPAYTGNATTTVSSDLCYISQITSFGTQRTFKARSMYKKYYTIYKITFETNGSRVLSWEEIPVF